MHNTFLSSRWRDIMALLILVLGISLFHARGLAPGQAFLPVDLANNNLPWRDGSPNPLQNWLISDPLYEFYPFVVHNVNSLGEDGSWPLWNPYIFLGHPVVADPLMQPFYPAYMGLGLLFGAARGLALGLWLHALLAAGLMYGFLRTIACTRRAAILGALTYVLSGYFVTWFEATHRTSTITWLPAILWAFELALQRRKSRYVALAALAYALAILGGQFQYMVTFSLFLGLIALGRTIELVGKPRQWQIYLWPLVALVLTVSLGALSSAILVVPFAEFLGMSKRVVSEGLNDPLAPRQLITLLVPNFYGTPVDGGAYWGSSNYSEGTIYAGLIALLLACLAPFTSRRFSTIYLFLVGLAILYFIIGGPGVQWLAALPGIKYASLHRSAFILPLIIAWLSARTLSEPKIPLLSVVIMTLSFLAMMALAYYLNWGQAQEHWSELEPFLLRATLLLALAFFLIVVRFYASDSRLSDWVLLSLVFVDLFLFGHRFNPTGPIADLMPPTPAIEYLQANVGDYRMVATQRNDEILFGPNIPLIFGLAEGGGYTSLVSARLHELISRGDPELDVWWMNRSNANMVPFSKPSGRLLDLLGVKYVVSPQSLEGDGIIAEQLVEGCEGESAEITANHVVGGSFVVQQSIINRLDVRFRVNQPEQRQGSVVIRMWRGADREQLMMESIQDATALENEQIVTIYFAPEEEAPGQTYVWEVSTTESNTGVGLCTNAAAEPAISVYGVAWSDLYQGEVHIFERLAPLPRARVIYAAEPIPDDNQAVARLLDHNFDLRNVAVTASSLELPTQAPLRATSATIVDYQATEVTIKASALQQGLLVLSDHYHPGWQAYVDGQPTTIHRTNQILRGVLLSPGEHEIIFRFEPSSLRIGAFLSMIGVVALLLLAALDWHRRIPG